ncbi:MAG: hypothetical protein LBC85_03780 [Fibromonadaceae bacterium]|jgi:hypothetical protein|nr:hypothetical protein [Fibromonadaceae bacterium]
MRLELEEDDGKAQEEILALYLPALFTAEFNACCCLKGVYKDRLCMRNVGITRRQEK